MKTRILILILIVTSLTSGVRAQDLETFLDKTDAFFKSHVVDGRIDYKAIKSNSSELDEILKLGEGLEIPVDDYLDYQAFWINSYNLLVIKSIVKNYPLKSPLDVPGFFDMELHRIGSTSITLNDIENINLRKEFPNEPRFHFVLVCAGLGCPPIIPQAYRPETLETQLETQTSNAINDPQFIRLGKKKVEISQIFEWYQEDFNRNGQTTAGFINSYRKEKIPADNKVGFYPYDWNLNEIR